LHWGVFVFFCLQICFFLQSGLSRLGDRAFTYCEEEEEEEEEAWECVGVGDSGGDALSDSVFLLCLFFSWLLHWKGAEFQRLCRNLLCPELYRKQFGNVCAGGVRMQRVLT
jgi:hypothetical protein